MPNRNFTSDNVAPAAAAILAAVNEANTGFARSYGADEFSARLQAVASAVFEKDVTIFPVSTGTAANALALAQLVPPFGAVYCHPNAHIVTDECGAPEMFSGGAKLIGLPAPDGKLAAEDLRTAVALALDLGVHHVKPAAVSVTQATEWGTVYRPAELAALSDAAHELGLGVHMDGARFANALAHLGCSPAEATWKCGVDVLSLGATKNGALCAEAVVFFDTGRAADFERRRKRAGHLWSKMRFLSAQLVAYLHEGLWLAHARHANAMAAALAAGITGLRGARLIHPVEANELFVALPEAAVAALEHAGFLFYRWPLEGLADAVAIRLVTSYATHAADVAELIAALRAIQGTQDE
ncbi:MAG: low specificity L-threonine aldolase [Gammaproteobacteria bacterium]|nr:low specificity L-threonine aldolase [Gammaproteobacteria bacterium]MDE2348870.1 low specificity L-threonine aldolase [Gammaproteobacteria bacterium]